jgi:hypothetical protein
MANLPQNLIKTQDLYKAKVIALWGNTIKDSSFQKQINLYLQLSYLLS